MNRVKKLKLNTISSLINRFVVLISGLILPRLIILQYGSEVNGLVSSISQFLSVITFLDLGVGSVVQSALYRPLADKEYNQINGILKAAKRYFRKISYILIIYVVILSSTYPLLISNQIDYLPTVLLVLSMSISIFAQYYFGIINEFLLNADQRGYIQLGSEIVVVILNLVASIFLIKRGYDIYIVKLCASLLFLIRPIYLSYYVSKNYNLKNYEDKKILNPLPQKWSGVGQHIAYSVQNSTDILVITLFSTLENVSIYMVYNMVVNSIRLLITSFTTGITSFFGSLLAERKIDTLNVYFSKIEWILHTVITLLYAATAVLIVPFISIYTSGVNDVSYRAPIFALLLTLSKAAYSLRTPYQSIVLAAGHFRQTQLSSIIEALLNILISFAMVWKFGLIGVTFGSLVAIGYRTVYLAFYLSKNILSRSIKIFFKHILIDSIVFLLTIFFGGLLNRRINVDTFNDWFLYSIFITLFCISLSFFINFIFYKDNTINLISSFKNKIVRRTIKSD